MKRRKLTKKDIRGFKRVLADLNCEGKTHECPSYNADCTVCQDLFPSIAEYLEIGCPCDAGCRAQRVDNLKLCETARQARDTRGGDMREKIELEKYQVRCFELILSDLQSFGTACKCPCIDCADCNRIFPKLQRKEFLTPDGSYCPCHAVRKGYITLAHVIRRVKRIIEEGAI